MIQALPQQAVVVTKDPQAVKVVKVEPVVKVGRDPKVLLAMWVIPPQALKVTKAQQAVKEILVAKDWVLALKGLKETKVLLGP